MRFAAPAALSGLLAMIVLEILKVVGPPILAWVAGVVLFVLKVGLALFATVAIIAVIWLVLRARGRSEDA